MTIETKALIQLSFFYSKWLDVKLLKWAKCTASIRYLCQVFPESSLLLSLSLAADHWVNGPIAMTSPEPICQRIWLIHLSVGRFVAQNTTQVIIVRKIDSTDLRIRVWWDHRPDVFLKYLLWSTLIRNFLIQFLLPYPIVGRTVIIKQTLWPNPVISMENHLVYYSDFAHYVSGSTLYLNTIASPR